MTKKQLLRVILNVEDFYYVAQMFCVTLCISLQSYVRKGDIQLMVILYY